MFQKDFNDLGATVMALYHESQIGRELADEILPHLRKISTSDVIKAAEAVDFKQTNKQEFHIFAEVMDNIRQIARKHLERLSEPTQESKQKLKNLLTHIKKSRFLYNKDLVARHTTIDTSQLMGKIEKAVKAKKK